MLVIFDLFAGILLFCFFLHAFYDLFLFDAVAQDFHQINGNQVGIVGRRQNVIDPLIGFAAHIDKQVAVGHSYNIVRSGLVIVQVNASIQEHGHICFFQSVSQDLADPVVFREDGGDDAERFFLGLLFRCGSRLSTAAAGEKSQNQGQSYKQGNKLFHW